jgi:hypothetical protein
MKRALTASATLLVLAMAAWFLWPGRDGESPAAPRLAFVAPGVAEVHNPARAETIEIFDEAGQIVARTPLFGRERSDVRFPWKPGARYRVVADGGPEAVVRAPATMTHFVVRVHAPLGQTPYEYAFGESPGECERREISVPGAPGETVDLMLEVEKLTDADPIEFDVSAAIESPPAGFRMEPAVVEEGVRLEIEFDKRIWTTQVELGDRLPPNPLCIALRGEGFSLPLALHFVSRDVGPESLQIVSWRLPTAADGTRERERIEDRVSIPNPLWTRLAPWFGIRVPVPDPFDPFAYQTVSIRNRSAQPISLLLAGEVVDARNGRPVGFFASPELESAGGMGRILAYAHLGPGETVPCVLPVYVRPDTPAGNYRRRIEIKPLGSDATLRVLEAPLGVVRSSWLFFGWVAASSVLSGGWLAAVFVFYRRMVRSMGVRLLVLLALLGSLQFALQFAGGMASMVLYAVLGPFNCLVGGLLTEVMTYLLVTSILYLVPRVGAITLAGLVSYVMGGILFGAFGLTDLLFMGSSVAFGELLLLAFGVTRLGEPRAGPPKLVPLMLALGAADAAATFTSIALQAVFYRLFFAPWYLVLQVAVTGFLYTVLGVYLGQPIGMSLRKVQP